MVAFNTISINTIEKHLSLIDEKPNKKTRQITFFFWAELSMVRSLHSQISAWISVLFY